LPGTQLHRLKSVLSEPAPRRYCELRERLPKVSEKALAERLRDLVLIRKLDHEQR
jgi:DNA-binding HxlR family transcriptional regulator